MNNCKVAEVIPLKMKLNRGFYYIIPESLKYRAEVGKRVVIPFRNSRKTGIITDILEKSDLGDLKEIEEVLDPVPVLSKNILTLTEWMSRNYLCPRGLVISSIIPYRISAKKVSSILDNISPGERLLNIDDNQRRTIERKNCHSDTFSIKKESLIDKINKPILFRYHSYRERDLYFINLIMKTIQKNRQVLILIPDQFSCIRLKEKLTRIFGESLAIFDRNTTPFQKYLRFIAVQKEEIKVVIGTRSNVFLPFYNLGLIIVEREESTLFKEERVPRYSAKEVALARGLLESSQIVFASSSPSVESYWNALNKEYALKEKKNIFYFKKIGYPEIFLVNLEEEKSFQRIISFQLQQLIIKYLKEKRGIILFSKRLGFASYVTCTNCSHIITCPDCGFQLSYQKEAGKRGIQLCNQCGKRIQYKRICPKCGNPSLKPMGYGTKFIEDLVHQMFPLAKTQCFDKDATPHLRDQTRILDKFKKGEIDILITTNFMYKRIDYRQTGLIGFILLDHLLNIPDYIIAEKTFQFLNQVILHLLEQKNQKSLLIQTYLPKHHSLLSLEETGYPLFYEKEIALRKELEYPPFTEIIKIDFIGADQGNLRDSVDKFKEFINKFSITHSIGTSIYINELYPVKGVKNNEITISLLIRMKTGNKDSFELKELLFSYILKTKKQRVRMIVDVKPAKLY